MYRLIFIAFLASVRAQLELEGACSLATVNAVENFNATQFSGQWFQIARIANEENGVCVTSTFSPVVENNLLVSATYNSRQVFNKTETWRNATVTPGTGKVLVFTYPDQALDTLVLDTDYDGFALLYSCWANATHKKVWAWQLGRANAFSAQQTTNVNKAIEQNADIKAAQWFRVGHSKQDCQTSGASVLLSPLIFSLAAYNLLSKLL
ncbi:unnamed protein product [Leptosia nina]|uniref:Lipocalin/cytosolic fatty-acid binding domain-containing protein n=1 Tax=Leptosia nina TaxID=320188 RepID=A0AAV1JBX2_9NEOP